MLKARSSLRARFFSMSNKNSCIIWDDVRVEYFNTNAHSACWKLTWGLKKEVFCNFDLNKWMIFYIFY